VNTSCLRSFASIPNSTTILIQDFAGIMYTGHVRIGTPSQTFRVIFDTGSADLWILSERMKSTRMNFLRYYNCQKSETYLKNDTAWGIQYGLGRCEGMMSRDVVGIGNLVVDDQAFAEVTSVTSNFLNPNQPMDGILGLGFRAGSSSQLPTLLDNLYAQGQINRRMFSFYLSSTNSVLASSPSELIIGSPDSSLYQGELFWTPVLYAGSPQMWFIRMDKLSVGGNSLNICGFWQNPCVALPDTGTSFISLPASKFDTIIALIVAGRSDCHMDFYKNVMCDDGPAGLPSITFQIDAHELVLTPEQYVLPNNQLAIQSLAPHFPDIDLFILGDPFLRSFYTVFDADGVRVGMANARAVIYQTPSFVIALLVLAGCLTGCLLIDCLYSCAKRNGEYTPLPNN